MNTNIFAFLIGVLQRLKQVSITFDHAEFPGGPTFMAITSDALTDAAIIEFKPDRGFGFYASDAVYTEGPAKVVGTVEDALKHFSSLILV